MCLLTKIISSRIEISGINGIKRRRAYSRLSYVHGIGSEPLKAITVGKLLELIAHKYPDREAVVSMHQSKRLTYREILAEADKLAAGLLTLGVQKGDRVGIWAPNLAEWVVAAAASARAGCISVAINPAYVAKEMEYCINKVKMKALICPDKVKKYNFYDILNEISPSLQKSEPGKLSCTNVPSLKNIIAISDETLKGTYNYKEVLDLADKATIKSINDNQHLIQPDSICNIQFTSGTTGQPKATILSHFNITNNSYFMGKRNELDQKHHKICVQGPLFHTIGITITITASFTFGSTMVLPSALYSSRDNFRALQEEKCSIIHGTPTMYVDLVNIQKQENADINPEIAVYGGAPCSPKLFTDMREILKVKKSVYGLTEATAGCFQSLPTDADKQNARPTVGYIHDHLEAKVIDADGNIVPIETPGELCVRGYPVMLGYWEDDARTKETIGVDGWLKTGDQFVLQEDGYARIVGRLKDMILRGGENIFPKEIEDLLNTHPDILESHVIGLTHKRLGEEVCACVRVRDDARLTHESLVEFCKGKIAHFKIPSQLRIVDSFPKTTSGKIQKYKLRGKMEEPEDNCDKKIFQR